MNDTVSTDGAEFSMLPNPAEDDFTVPNTVNIGIVSTASVNDDNPMNGQPTGIQTLTGSIGGALDSLTNIIEGIGGVKTAVEGVLDNKTPAVTTAPVSPPPVDYTPFILLALAGIAVVYIINK